jgi:fluoride exporter
VTYLLVAVGGALGATARYLVADLVHRVASPYFPWGTFVVNVSGCFVFGLVAGAGEAFGVVGPLTRAFVLVGILGGYTTFSSFTFETATLARGGELTAALGNIVGQVVVGLIAFWAAAALVQAIAAGARSWH